MKSKDTDFETIFLIQRCFIMFENKFWSFSGIALAVMAFFYKKIEVSDLILLGVLTVLGCFLISYIWNKIINSNHVWIDAICFFFSKTSLPYVVTDKLVNYSINDSQSAEYRLKCILKIRKAPHDFCYKGRYHWDQEDDINVNVLDSKNFRMETNEDLKWSNVDIFPVEKIVHRNETIECGFSLTNLHITRLNKHSYLSCKMIEKVRALRLNAKVNPTLKPSSTAHFIIQNKLGDEISREEIKYNETSSSYEKTIRYPRKGRKYIIKWGYEK